MWEAETGWVFVVCTHQLVAATCCQSKLRHCRRRRWSTENVSSVKLSGSFYTGRSVLSGFAVWFTFLFTKSLAEISNRTDFGLNYWAVFFLLFVSKPERSILSFMWWQMLSFICFWFLLDIMVEQDGNAHWQVHNGGVLSGVRRLCSETEDCAMRLKTVRWDWRLCGETEDCVMRLKTVQWDWRLCGETEDSVMRLKTVCWD